jgi:hypothetical protein
MVMGDRGRIGPRTLLREEVNRNAQRLVGRAVGAALSPETDDAKAAGIAIRLIEQSDPPAQATVEVRADVPIEEMSYSELIAFARSMGMDVDAMLEEGRERAEAKRLTPPALLTLLSGYHGLPRPLEPAQPSGLRG